MAAAAAAAAAEVKAQKELDSAMKIVPTLQEILDFDKFKKALALAAYQFTWPEWILDLAFPEDRVPQDARRNVDDADGNQIVVPALTLKNKLDTKNAYTIIMAKCEGHTVAYTLDDGAMGDARGTYKLLHDYFYRPTQAGKSSAFSSFYSMSMANTDTTIAAYMSLVASRSANVRQHGSEVDHATMITRILDGLLPEFDSIKLILEQRQGLTLADCKATLLDYAKQKNLETLTKGGNVVKRNKTFTAGAVHEHTRERVHESTNANQPRKPRTTWWGEAWIGGQGDCQYWHRGKCNRGHKCKFDHPPRQGGGTNTHDKSDTARTAMTIKADKSQGHCLYCGDTSHYMRACPEASKFTSAVNKANSDARVHFADSSSRKPDHVFMINSHQPQTDVRVTHAKPPTGAAPHEARKPFKLCQRAASSTRQSIEWLFDGTCSIMFGMFYLLLFAAPLFAVAKLWTATDRVTHAITRTYKPLVFVLLLLACSIQVLAWQAPTDTSTHGNTITSRLYFNNDTVSRAPSVSELSSDYEWCADSGTNRFVTNDLLDFVPGTVVHSSTVVSVGSGNVTSPMSGTVRVESLDHGCLVECRDVLYLPDCEKKLMPVSTFVKKGSSLLINDTDKINLTARNGSSIFSGREFDGLYHYRCKTVRDSLQAEVKATPEINTYFGFPNITPTPKADSYFGLAVGAKISASSQDFGKRLLEAHWAYGHLHFNKLRKLLGLKKGDDPDCPACTIARSRQATLSKEKYDRSTRPHHRAHIDIGFTKNYDYCFQLYVDDCTRESCLDVLDTKGDAFNAFKQLHQQRNNDYAPYKLAVLRSDSEPLYCTPAWDTYCEQNGIRREFSSRYRHDQHGVAERAMQAIGVPFRCMMIQGCAPESDIPDCLRHANVIRNHSPTKANKGWTPREKAAGKKLPVNKRLMQGPLFCLVFAHVYEQERAKHAPRGIASVYLGYDDVNNAYKVKEWESGKRYYTADVTFYPHRFPYRANPHRMADWLHQFDDFAPHVITAAPGLNQNGSISPPRREASSRQREYQYSAGQALHQIPDVDVPPAINYTGFSNCFVHNFGPEPANWSEALDSKYANEWIAAKLAEQNSFAYHNVFEIVPRTAARGKKIFKPRPVLKIKVKPPSAEHPHGCIDKFKYRLTIAAFTRMLTQGIDYEEKYASTVRWNSIKLLIAIAVKMDYDIVLFDISTFFLYGKLHDEVYMEQASGWEVEGKPKEEYICKLLRSMYGLPQAPHCAQLELKETLTTAGKFKATAADDCIYVSGQGEPAANKDNGYAALGAHVDDLTGVGDVKGLAKIEAALGSKFKFTKEVNPAVITGVQIERNRKARWLKLHQAAYVNELLEKHNMADCRSVDTPMDPGTARVLMRLSVAETPDPVVLKKYQSLVGAFIWLLKTRPDMMFTINLVSRFMKNATQQHLDLVSGRPLRYLKGTVDYGIVFQADDEEWQLSAASDSDLAGCLNTSRSTSGCYSKLGKSGAVMCSSSLEKKISTSTGQAETYAMQSLVKEVVWERHLLSELRFHQCSPTLLLTDNDGVLKQSTKAINHSTAKHYRIAQAYIRSMVQNQTIKVDRIDTAANPADLFTKALHAPAFHRHRATIMGPQSPNM